MQFFRIYNLCRKPVRSLNFFCLYFYGSHYYQVHIFPVNQWTMVHILLNHTTENIWVAIQNGLHSKASLHFFIWKIKKKYKIFVIWFFIKVAVLSLIVFIWTINNYRVAQISTLTKPPTTPLKQLFGNEIFLIKKVT